MIQEPANRGHAHFQPIAPGPFDHLGPEAKTAYDPRASDSEVEDASSRLMKIYGASGGGDNVGPGIHEMLEQFAQLQRIERHAEGLAGGLVSLDRNAPLIAKAEMRDGRMAYGEKLTPEGKAITTSWANNFGHGAFKWLPKRGVSYQVLRSFARRLEVAQAIIRTRKRQVDRFSRVSRSVDDIGWRLVMADEEASPGAGLKDEMRWLTRVLECGGREFSSVKRRELRRQGMTQFLRYLIEDALVLDNAAVELIGLKDVKHGLDSWFVRPSETFALASPVYGETLPDGRPVYAFQVCNGRAEVPFGYDELALFVRNASTWAEENGYGYSEFEQSLDTLNNVIQAITYTKQGLSENAVPRGILMAYGNYDVQTQNAFKAAWAAKVRGVQNQFSTPVLFSRGQQGGVQYLNTGQPFDEMAFAKWIGLNMTIMGAIFGVAPEEVGFEGFSADKSSLSGNDTAEKLAAAKDKGLHPLLKDVSSFMTEEVVQRFGTDLRFEFTGLDTQNTETRWQEKLKHMTINEVRALFDLPQHPLGWFGDLPADTAQQSAEFQRLNATMTLGEGRKTWGGLPAFPSAILELAPMNPSMGALYQSVLSVPLDGGGEEDGQGEGSGEDGESSGMGDSLASRLSTLAGSDGAPSSTLDEMRARAGVEEQQ